MTIVSTKKSTIINNILPIVSTFNLSPKNKNRKSLTHTDFHKYLYIPSIIILDIKFNQSNTP